MIIERTTAVHEAGHMIAGFALGLQEQGIIFNTGDPNHAARAVYSYRDPESTIVRSFAGVHAHHFLLPETLEAHVREAYQHSVIFDPDHPNFDCLSDAERSAVSGAKDDIAIARAAAALLHPDNPTHASEALRAGEHRARSMVTQYRNHISTIFEDIFVWICEPARQWEPLLLYPPRRAQQALGELWEELVRK